MIELTSIGRANRKPWPSSQPRSRSDVICSVELDPLGHHLQLSVPPSAITAAASPSSGPDSGSRNERSIFRMSTGKRLR